MALTTHQINQAYVSVLGRAAIGTEIAKAAEAESVSALAASLIAEQQAADKLVPSKAEVDVSTFSSLDSDVITNSKGASSTEFVENLYSTFLNRGSDEEGLAYWKGVLANGATKEEVVSAFKAAIISQAAENTEDYIAYQEAVAAKATAFLDYLYLTDLGRPSDEDGLAYWAGEIAKGATYAQIIEAFTAAAEAQGTKTDDGVAFANKLAIADHATEKLQSFSKTATAANIAAAKGAIRDQIANINGESGEDSMTTVKETVDEIANTYKTQGSKSFTTKADDKLGVGEDGAYNTTAATNFTGTYNVADETKGTIQKSDAVYGNNLFTNGNVLTVNVTGATTTVKDYKLDLPGIVSNIGNLVVKGSGVSIKGEVDATNNYNNTVTIEAGYAEKDANASEITLTAGSTIDTYKGGAKADQLTLGTTDKVANINLGAGKDTLVLTTNAAAINYNSIKSLSSVEEIQLKTTAAANGATIDYDAIKGNLSFALTNEVAGASGHLTINAGENKTIDVSKIVNGKINENGVFDHKVVDLTISGVKANSTIKLEGAVAGNDMTDIIKLSGNDATNVTITNVGTGDILDAVAAGVSNTVTAAANAITELKANAKTVTTAKAYFMDVNKSITSAADAKATLDGISAVFKAADAKALIGFNNGEKSYLFAANDANSDTVIDVEELKLIAIVDNKFGDGETIASGVITFG